MDKPFNIIIIFYAKVGVDNNNQVKTSNKQARGNSSDFCEVYVTAEPEN